MPEPSSPLLLATNQCNPLIAAPTQPFPDIWVSIHPPRLLRLLECAASSSTNAMRETFVVPKRRVFQHQPAARFTNPTPPFAFIAMTPYPARSVEIAIETKLLFVWDQVWIRRIHIFWRGRDLFFVKGGVEVRWIGEVGIVGVERVRISVALKHAEEAMR
jgi:hypothetical protein